MEILILGAGYVGTATALTFAELGHSVTCIDTDREKIESLQAGEPYFYEPDLKELLNKHLKDLNVQFCTEAEHAIERSSIIFICVGTPSNESGDADITYVQQVSETIGRNMNGYKIIVVKSTVPVGTCLSITDWISKSQRHTCAFDVVSNPEFLREGTALQDSLHPHRVIIGSTSEHAATMLVKLYEPMKCPIVLTNPHAAELIKYASNSFLATKISFVNELARLCDALHVNVRDVALGMGLDPRIGDQFLNAGIGYGGSCFPKDVSSLLATSERYGVNLSILKEVKNVNYTQYLYFLNKIQGEVGTFDGKLVAVFGLAFKPNTSDTRDSPTLSIIKYLVDHGAKVNIHDPVATLPSWLQKPVIRQCQTPEETVHHADVIITCTDWSQYTENVDWSQLKLKMRNVYIFDGRNMLNVEYIRSLGFSYSGIGC